MAEYDAEGRLRRCIYLPEEMWDWIDEVCEHDRVDRSSFFEGLVLLDQDRAERAYRERIANATR